MKLNITLHGRRFYRSTTNAWFFGLCGGLADHFGWETKWVRLALAIATVAVPGIGTLGVIAAYFALGLMIPSREQA